MNMITTMLESKFNVVHFVAIPFVLKKYLGIVLSLQGLAKKSSSPGRKQEGAMANAFQ